MDSDHRENKEESQRAWRQQNPEYWKLYRERNPEYFERNRRLQRKRDLKWRHKNLLVTDESDLAKKDALDIKSNEKTGG